MRCMNCGVDVPPAYVKSIELNKCPACDESIMNEASQELLKELANALTRMPNDPQGVAGWLLSNYRFQKMGDAQPTEKFYRKGGGQASNFDDSNLKIAPGYNELIGRNDPIGKDELRKTAQLAARGNELAARKGGKLAEFANMIQQVGDPYGDNTTNTGTIKEEKADERIDPEDQKSYLELKASGFDPFIASAPSTVNSSEFESSDVVSKLARVMSQDNKPIAYELALSQTDEGRKQLQLDNFKRIKAQDAVSGGGTGFFRRA